MGMSSYVMDAVDEFIEQCESVAKQSESFQEYCEVAVLNDGIVPHLNPQQVADLMSEIWNQLWSS